MATQNAIDSGKPIGVDDGGTGSSTLTDHGVLVGSGTSAITVLSVGGTGALLVGTVGADPAFSTSATGDFTFTRSTAGERVLNIDSLDNTTATSHAYLEVITGGSSGGDSYVRTNVTGVTSHIVGLDNSDSDKFKMSRNNVDIGTNNDFASTTAGEIIKPRQSAFGAVAANQTDVTGDGTVYTVTFTSAEYFDQNNDFDGTSTFTAPVTGRYQFNIVITCDGIGAQTTSQTRLVTSNRNYIPGLTDPSVVKDASNQLTMSANFFVDMDAADTAQAAVFMSGSTKTVDVLGANTFFNGMLVC